MAAPRKVPRQHVLVAYGFGQCTTGATAAPPKTGRFLTWMTGRRNRHGSEAIVVDLKGLGSQFAVLSGFLRPRR
jgi:hypothetical protein